MIRYNYQMTAVFLRAREKLTCDISSGNVCVCACAWLLCPVEDRSVFGRCCCCCCRRSASDLSSSLHLNTPIITAYCILNSLSNLKTRILLLSALRWTSSIPTVRPNLTPMSCCTLYSYYVNPRNASHLNIRER